MPTHRMTNSTTLNKSQLTNHGNQVTKTGPVVVAYCSLKVFLDSQFVQNMLDKHWKDMGVYIYATQPIILSKVK